MENDHENVCCKWCGSKNVEVKENVLMIYAVCLDCHETTLVESKDTYVEPSKVTVTCPYCKSTNTEKITTTAKVVNTAVFGLFGTKRLKNWHCNSCKTDF